MMDSQKLRQLTNLQRQMQALEEEMEHLFAERKNLCRESNSLLVEMLDVKENFSGVSVKSDFEQNLERVAELPAHAQVACQGVEGAYSHQAADKLFARPKITFCPQFEDVFRAVEQGEVAYGILPIENSTAGSVVPVYDLMRRYNFYIVKETKVAVQHCLLAGAGATADSIRDVYSHPQALNQCQEYFTAHPQYCCHEYSNTAAAAQYVAQQKDVSLASVSSMKCAQLYGLQVIQQDIQDILHNTTRFICISKQPGFSAQANKISICLTLPHQSGSLYHLLHKIAINKLNLTKLESRPWPERTFEFLFYLDMEGNVRDPQVQWLLNEFHNQLGYFKFLGNYDEVV